MMGLWLVMLFLCLFFLTGSVIALFFNSLRPEAKWAASASASGLFVSFLLLGLSSDREDQQGRELGFVISADRRSAERTGVTAASARAEEAEARRRADAAVAEKTDARQQTEAAKAEETEARRRADAAMAEETGARRRAEAAKAEETDARRRAEAVGRRSTTPMIIRGGRKATRGDQF